MEFDLPALINGLAGLAALVVALTLRPAILSLKKLSESHEERLDKHDVKLVVLEERIR